MELITSVMNLVLPPLILICLIVVLPPYLIYKFMLFITRLFFAEDVSGKVVVVTGASSGIGEHIVYEYAKRRARLVLVARRESRLREVAENARIHGSPDVISVCADVSIVDDCKRFIDETISHFGQLDHLVNNAGIISTYYFEETIDITNPRSLFDINFWGSIYPTHFAIPHLKKSKGKIVVNTSLTAWFYGPVISFYGASKGALLNFYETLRVELGSEVGITLLSPGLVASEMSEGKLLSKEGAMEVNKEKLDALVGMVPVRSVEECAKVIVNGICRGKRWVTDPSFYEYFNLFKIFVPEIAERVARLLFVAKQDTINKLS
ncbi:hypothetical protein GIB67_008144 [Kingdonia uniflora]|uniref:Uncharacterized protein n=1 Tax=Kingdonia uniflora TaxID=39325 RepID=A0A7J7MSX7_9MAGN|nr:hypothetical protein GIB67_008144 [Kingdonia uniflora]